MFCTQAALVCWSFFEAPEEMVPDSQVFLSLTLCMQTCKHTLPFKHIDYSIGFKRKTLCTGVFLVECNVGLLHGL